MPKALEQPYDQSFIGFLFDLGEKPAAIAQHRKQRQGGIQENGGEFGDLAEPQRQPQQDPPDNAGSFKIAPA